MWDSSYAPHSWTNFIMWASKKSTEDPLVCHTIKYDRQVNGTIVQSDCQKKDPVFDWSVGDKFATIYCEFQNS